MTVAKLTDDELAGRLRGIALMCLAVLLFTVIDTSAKYAGRYVPTVEVIWARYTVSVVVSVIVLRPWQNLALYATGRPLAQFVRSIFLFASTAFNFFAIHYLPLAETVSIAFSAPLLVTALSGPILGEWAGPRRWIATVIGFVGVLIIIQPQSTTFHPAIFLSLAAAGAYAGYYLTTRMLSTSESPSAMLVYGSLFGAVLMSPGLPAFGTVPPTWLVAVALVSAGLAAGLGHWLLILASARAPATVLAPFTYTQIIWMVAAGYLFFGDLPKRTTVAGVTIVIAAGLYILYRERVHRDR